MSFQPAVRVIENHAAQFPAMVAMRQKRFGIWQEYTWPEVNKIMREIASSLLEAGISKNTKVGILSENRREWVLTQFGIQAAGGIVVGMYATSPSVEIEHFVITAQVEVLFIEDQEQFDKIVELKDRLPTLRKLVVFDPKGLSSETLLDLQSFDDFVDQGKLHFKPETVQSIVDAIEPDDTCLLVFTSGSTDKPKAAEISHGNIQSQMKLVAGVFDTVGTGTNLLSYLPLNHVAEQAVTVCGSLAGPRVMNFGESLRTITADLRDVAPELFFGVPRIWEKMQATIQIQTETAGPLRRLVTRAALQSARKRMKTPRSKWSVFQHSSHIFWDILVYRHIRSYVGLGKCKIAISAAAPISTDVLQFFRGIGLDLREAWGMTETSGAATSQIAWGECEGRVGHLFDELELKIADDGELLVKGDIIFKGYYRDPEATAKTVIDGWLHTGDIAEIAEDGSVSIVDRKKDIMINAAGKNLSPTTIENAIKSSPFVKECVVVADERPYVSALVQIDFDTVRLWAENEEIVYTTFRSLAENPKIIELIDDEVNKYNAQLARVEQVKKVHLMTKELDHDDGEVTATMKVRRSNVTQAFAAEIEAFYGS